MVIDTLVRVDDFLGLGGAIVREMMRWMIVSIDCKLRLQTSQQLRIATERIDGCWCCLGLVVFVPSEVPKVSRAYLASPNQAVLPRRINRSIATVS